MFQIPGGTGVKFVTEHGVDEIGDRIRGERQPTLIDVFTECLKRLNAPLELRKQLPGQEYIGSKPSPEWKEFLDEQEEIEDGLLNVAAEIIDELIVRPEMDAMDEIPQPVWWQEWWRRIRVTDQGILD